MSLSKVMSAGKDATLGGTAYEAQNPSFYKAIAEKDGVYFITFTCVN